MREPLNLKYYRGDEPDNLCFYRIPKVLFTKACFEEVSTDAKVLYGILLDYASLSRENRWLDENSRVYIYYSVQRVCAYMGCKKDKAMKLLADLEDFGLIERVKRGQGKSDIIYVKSFEVPEDAEDREVIKSLKKDAENHQEVVEKTDRSEKPTTLHEEQLVEKTEWSEIPTTIEGKKVAEKTDWSEKPTTSYEEKPVGKIDRSEIPTSCGRKNRLLEVGKTDPNNTNYNDTENINSNPIHLSYGGRTSVKQKIREYDDQRKEDGLIDGDSIYAPQYLKILEKNLEYEWHMKYDSREDKEIYAELFKVILQTVSIKRDSVNINGTSYPYEVVKSRFLKLNSDHIEYVMDCMRKTTTKINNIRAYMLTALFNSPDTMKHYYQQEVQHDLYGNKDFESDTDYLERMRGKYGGAI